jgi:hypothetical protein
MKNYLVENNFAACSQCYYSDCYLVNPLNTWKRECGLLGKKISVEELDVTSKKKFAKPDLLFQIEDIHRYAWQDVGDGETFISVPLDTNARYVID